MKRPILGKGFKYRDLVPENGVEAINLFQLELDYFISWSRTVSPKRKKSPFWECDYDEQLYLDTMIEHVFGYFPDLRELDRTVIANLIYVITRNHEQGNLLAWMNPELPISYLGMTKSQFKFLANLILKDENAEENAVFQVVVIFRKMSLEEINEKEVKLLEGLRNNKSEFVRYQLARTLEYIDKLKS